MADALQVDTTVASTQSPPWLGAYHGFGEGAPIWRYAGYDDDFKVEQLSHTGDCKRSTLQHQMSVDQCDLCKQLCLDHNQSLARRTGAEATARNPMSSATGIQQTLFAPDLCAKVGALFFELFDSYNSETKRFDCAALSQRGLQPDLRGFSGFELIQGQYGEDQQGRSSMILHATQVAALAAVCPELPELIGSHAATMPSDTVVGHHTLLCQGADNPGVVFDWHTDTAQENNSSDRGSGEALLTAIHLIWTSPDYDASGMEVMGKQAVVYSTVGDTMVFSAHCVHKSIKPKTGECIKLVTTYTHKTALPSNLQHNRAARLFQAAQYGADTQPSADLASMIYSVLRNVNTMHECTQRAYSFMLLMAAGAMSVAPSLVGSSLTTPVEVNSVITSTIVSLSSQDNEHALVGCKRCAHRRAPILIG